MKFNCRKLIENIDTTVGSTSETIWAYILETKKETKSGRYRVRISRFNRQQVALLSGGDVDSLPDEFQFGLQASLDIFDMSNGWIPLLDWMGDPESSDKSIQRELNEQIQAFLTGKPSSRQEWKEKQMQDLEGDSDEPSDTRKAWMEDKIKTPPSPPEDDGFTDDPVDQSFHGQDEEESESDDDDWI